ncbi:hypothetical protein GCM10023318_03370 [Nocardia callitridis]|uniref:TetR family transcriptional regulator n=2 Tax=Nocardia callitridis TaxID=648753 RepID=A0ABP9JRQ4_9NOCA
MLGPALLEVSARKILNRLHATHGVPAFAAAAEHPALSAAIDQHAAAVRDILSMGIDGATKVPPNVLLAGYARGLLDQADEPADGSVPALHDPAPLDVDEWLTTNWLHLRLAGVCLHASSYTTGRTPA